MNQQLPKYEYESASIPPSARKTFDALARLGGIAPALSIAGESAQSLSAVLTNLRIGSRVSPRIVEKLDTNEWQLVGC